jgi:pimeloyl-ACP methyl ester carboxylesterase
VPHPGNGPVAYLARPCQYFLPSNSRCCNKAYWTNARYAPEVIESTNAAIDFLEAQTEAAGLVLVGYSGGGALAVLATSQRKDVIGIITIASNLDLADWTKRNELSPLKGSRDPADVASAVAIIPQIHFVGGKDEVVSPDVVQTFLKRMPPNAPARMIVMPDYTHTCCWAETWGHLFMKAEGLQYLPFNTSNIIH